MNFNHERNRKKGKKFILNSNRIFVSCVMCTFFDDFFKPGYIIFSKNKIMCTLWISPTRWYVAIEKNVMASSEYRPENPA